MIKCNKCKYEYLSKEENPCNICRWEAKERGLDFYGKLSYFEPKEKNIHQIVQHRAKSQINHLRMKITDMKKFQMMKSTW